MTDIPGGLGSATIGRTVEVNRDLIIGLTTPKPTGLTLSRETVADPARPGQTKKYRNRKITLDGFDFDSQKEARRYNTLATLQHARRISELKVHPPFDLLGRDGSVVYRWTADFSYLSSEGVLIVEDCKSAATRKKDTWPVIRKLFRATYGFDISEV